MTLLRYPTIKSWPCALLLVAVSAGAQAQTADSDNEAKLLRCQQNATDLIWLDREKLRARCGLWDRRRERHRCAARPSPARRRAAATTPAP